MVLALVEHDDGSPFEESLQMLTLARDVAAQEGSELAAVAFGSAATAVVDHLDTQGVSTVYAVDSEALDTYAPVAWASTLDELAETTNANAILAAGTDRGNEVLAHLGAKRDLPMAANCLAVDVNEAYELRRQRWGGSLIEHATLESEPKVLTVALHELPVENTDVQGETTLETVVPNLEEDDLAVRVDRFEASEEEGISIEDADIVIGGGRGVGSAEDFDILETLADEIGAAVGSSRAAVNEGWRPHDDQIGLTGHKISPEIYIAAGISGAVQHMVGCKGAKHILAINTDPEAGIIQKSNWAILGDLHEVIPAITEAVKQRENA